VLATLHFILQHSTSRLSQSPHRERFPALFLLRPFQAKRDHDRFVLEEELARTAPLSASRNRIDSVLHGLHKAHNIMEPTPPEQQPALAPSIQKTNARPIDLRADLGGLAHWFLPAIALIYGAGFLINFTFASTFGIREVQLLQARCIHIGSLFIIGCMIIWVLGMWLFQLRASPGAWKSRFSGVLAFVPMLLVFYILVAFTDRSFYQNHAALVLSNFMVPVFYVVVGWATGILIAEVRTTATLMFQFVVAVAALIVAAFTLYQDRLWEHVGAIFSFWPPTGGAGFVILNGIIITYVLITEKRLREFASDWRSMFRIGISSVAVVGVLFYLAVLSFAYAVFPFVPAERGGGDYRNVGHVAVTLRHSEDNPFPADVRDLIKTDQSPLILLDENSDLLFFAFATEAGGPAEWQKTSGEKPRVFELRRDGVANLIYLRNQPLPTAESKPAE
jgi:hypothetical protein